MSAPWRLACGWITLFVVGTDLFIISPLLPRIATQWGLSVGMAGLSVTVFSLTYLIGAPLFGQLADRFGRRRTLVGCLLGFVAANLLTAAAPSFGWLLAVRVAAGAAASGVAPLIYAGVGEAAPPARRATWMAIAVSGLLLALSVGAPTGTIIASYLGWRAPFVVLGLLSLGLAAANRLIWPADPRRTGQAGAPLPALNLPLVVRRLFPTVLWATALYGVYTYLGTWLTLGGSSAAEIARAIGYYGVGALGGTLLGGQLADRFGTTRTMLLSVVGLAAGLAAFSVGVGSGWAVDILLLVMSAFAQFYFPAQQSGLARDFPERRALMLALNNSALFLGISLGSLIGGEAMALSGFNANAGVCAVIACLALVSIRASNAPARISPTG
ncbi:MAG TPA: MFS transporter [Acetobacteraceae bacterium]|jgi:predicted MFS family arabinose efflux permease|nr:MFS transporter [Acetobacteraceae bacterium]